MKNWLQSIGLMSCLTLLAFTDFAWSIESTGRLEFYKGGQYSSHAHLLVDGAAARDLYLHMTQVPDQDDAAQKIRIRKGPSFECVFFYGENGSPYRCYAHLNEAGLLRPGYAPSK